MNETLRSLRNYVIVLIIGGILSAGILYTTIKSRADRDIAAMQVTLDELTDNNTRLTEDKAALDATVERLTAESNQRQAIIDGLTATVGSIGSGLDSAAGTIQDVIDRISELESRITSTEVIQ